MKILPDDRKFIPIFANKNQLIIRMKKIFTFLAVAASLLFTACDDTTDNIGGSIIDNGDKLSVSTDTFDVTSKTILTGAVFARSSIGYLGRMTDAETNTSVSANFMSQFHVLDNYRIGKIDSITSKDASNKIIADSCGIRLFYTSYYGDSLAQMKLTAYEMQKPVEEGTSYDSNFDPLAQGYIRTSNGIAKNRSYTLADLTESDSLRNSSDYSKNINIRLNDPYTDKNGVTYNNFGTYILRKFQEDSTAFRNSYRFLHEICPGFYFKIDDNSIGSMARIDNAQLNIYYRVKNGSSQKATFTKLVGTEEVLQLTNFSNNTAQLNSLASETGHTYLKTPAGLLTQLSLPITDILAGHDKDSINSAKIEVQRINNSTTSPYNFSIPQNVIMLPADSLLSFFANNKLTDNKTSYMATYNSTKNAYIFNNISGIVSLFIKNKAQAGSNANWGKVVLVPVEVQTSTVTENGQKRTVVTKISNLMGLSSTKLLSGTGLGDGLKLSVIYSKFNGR